MNFDDDDDFNPEDMTPEEREKIEREMRERDNKLRTHPLFKKAREIYNTVSALVESFSDKEKEMQGNLLIESAMMLAPKLAGAINSESWLICMQNAAIIRYHGEYLHTATSGLRMYNEIDKEYIQLLRTDMEEFRELFKEWIKVVNTMEDEDFEDDWGLFIRNK